MATKPHPITGVPLNIIEIQRQHLDPAEAETARLLVHEGHDQHIAAAMLGVNLGRVNEALKDNPTDPRQPGLNLDRS